MTNLVQDIRYMLRTLRKAPAFAVIATATLAFGIGANTAIFTLVNATFFHSLPVRSPERLVSIFTLNDQLKQGASIGYLSVSFPNGQDIKQQAKSFSAVTLYTTTEVSMTVAGRPERLTAQVVSGNFFDILGIQMARGHTFLSSEDMRPGADPVVVLSYGLWVSKFAADPKVIGSSVLLNGNGFTIIGVAPLGFQGPARLAGPDLWVPMSMHQEVLLAVQEKFFNERRAVGFSVVGRLKIGASVEQARAELKAIGSNLAQQFPLSNKKLTFIAVPLLQSDISPNVRGLFKKAGELLMTAVGLILLIACTNVANLLFARAAGRKREIAIRLAVGASRARIFRQLLTEALVLATVGGSLGLGLAVVGRDILWKFRPPFMQHSNMDLAIDGRVLVFTFCTAVGASLLFGIVPALQFFQAPAGAELKEGAQVEPHSKGIFSAQKLLVILEVAFCLVGLVGAGLFMLSLHKAQQIDPGFDAQEISMISFDLGSLKYDLPHIKEFDRAVLEAAQNTPGVQSAALATAIPLLSPGVGRSVIPERAAQDSSSEFSMVAWASNVSQNYFQTMGIPLLEGRGFDSVVREDSPKVAIINEVAAHSFWPNEDPIGKRFRFNTQTDWIQVIGVGRNSKYVSLGEEATPYLYLPLVQNPNPSSTLFIRTRRHGGPVLEGVRSQVQALDRNLPLTNVWPVGDVVSQSLWSARFGAGLLAVFAVAGVVLCVIGIYGVAGYTVERRTREIGIRMALGAQRADIIFMILSQSGITLGLGLIFGSGASFILSRFIGSLLYRVSPGAPLPYIAMSLILSMVGLLASYMPARRASKADPSVTLRHQ